MTQRNNPGSGQMGQASDRNSDPTAGHEGWRKPASDDHRQHEQAGGHSLEQHGQAPRRDAQQSAFQGGEDQQGGNWHGSGHQQGGPYGYEGGPGPMGRTAASVRRHDLPSGGGYGGLSGFSAGHDDDRDDDFNDHRFRNEGGHPGGQGDWRGRHERGAGEPGSYQRDLGGPDQRDVVGPTGYGGYGNPRDARDWQNRQYNSRLEQSHHSRELDQDRWEGWRHGGDGPPDRARSAAYDRGPGAMHPQDADRYGNRMPNQERAGRYPNDFEGGGAFDGDVRSPSARRGWHGEADRDRLNDWGHNRDSRWRYAGGVHQSQGQGERHGRSPQGQPSGWGSPASGGHDWAAFDPHYEQWRSEQMRRLDEDYRSWQQDRYQQFSRDFDQWRDQRRQGQNLSRDVETGGYGTPSGGGTHQTGSTSASLGASTAGASREGGHQDAGMTDADKSSPGQAGSTAATSSATSAAASPGKTGGSGSTSASK